MQFWRELPAAEQSAALASAAHLLFTWPTIAELVAAKVAATPSSLENQNKKAVPPGGCSTNSDGASLPPLETPANIALATGRRRYDFPAEEFDRLCRLAQDQLAQKFDLPPQFPPRAREGLLGSLVLVAANEALGDEPYSDQSVAEIHLLLLKPE